MRVAVISDIHGNLPALEAVLDEIAREDLRDVWCLGDTVGYGADPNDCCRLVREATEVCLLYTSDAAADLPCVAFGGPRIIKQKKNKKKE